MRIGILTFHRAHNYGAVLQCYALQEVLKGMGHEVEVIDYRQPNIERTYKIFSLRELVISTVKFWRLKTFIEHIYQRYLAKKLFRTFQNKYLNITKHSYNSQNIPSDFDRYIIGSDQLFNPGITRGLDNVYSGFFHTKIGAKKIGYAISMSNGQLEIIGRIQFESIIKNFSAFSFRENKLCKTAYKLTSIQIPSCVDPTLLTDSKIWSGLIAKSQFSCNEKYIALYQVRPPHNNKDAVIEKAQELAQLHHLKLIDISKGYSLEDWVCIIKNSQCVITSSFHATVFSLIFNIPLYAFKLGDGADERYVELLEKCGLSERAISLSDSITNIEPMKWNQNERLSNIRKDSLSYIEKALSKDE